MRTLFITGTDTGVGKTQVACALLHEARARGLACLAYKPVAAGCRKTPEGLHSDDALALQSAAGSALPYAELNTYAIHEAIAPHLGAADQGIEISPHEIRRQHGWLAGQTDLLLVEGAGGWQLPLTPAVTMADVVAEAGWPVLLVVGMRLGCLSHALLTVESITRRTHLVGWVANCLPPRQERLEDNIRTLASRIEAPLLGVLGPVDAGYDVPEPRLSLDRVLKRLD